MSETELELMVSQITRRFDAVIQNLSFEINKAQAILQSAQNEFKKIKEESNGKPS